MGDLFDENSRPNIRSWYNNIKSMEIFEKAVSAFIPEALITVLGKFGEDQKEQVFKIMEEN